MTIIQQISLAYKDSGSDKVYHAQIEEADGVYVVNFQYGRRGSALTTGSKTATGVELAKAQAIYQKLIKEKTAKGYSEGESGAVFQSKTLGERFTGIVPQLLNKIVDPALFVAHRDYFMQEKKDGVRRIIKIVNGEVTSINKKGLEVLSPQSVCDPLLALGVDITVDGELVGETYFLFDILGLKGDDVRGMKAAERYHLLAGLKLPNTVKSYFTQADKAQALAQLQDQKKEGIVFKQCDSLYVSGRPNSGGNQLKYKFYSTDTFEVVSHSTARRSISVVSYDKDGMPYDMGSITIPQTTPMPDVGAFVEVRYLYCNIGGKLFQTTFLNVRDDQDRSDCHMRDIKFKPPGEDDEE